MKAITLLVALIAALMVIGAAPSFVVSPDEGTSNGAYSVLEPLSVEEASACPMEHCWGSDDCVASGWWLKCKWSGGNGCETKLC